jgi:succinate-semialdehyde dehydrogenase/glutarate-semialdehyde dehydrogenase
MINIYDSQKLWAKKTIQERVAEILKIKEYFVANKQICADLITHEMGKIPSEAIAEVEKCLKLMDYYAKEAPKFLETEVINTEFKKSYVRFEPLGIVFGIMPWNFPFWQVFRFAVPSLLAGNVVLLKHANNVPLCSKKLEEIFNSSGSNIFQSLIISAKEAEEVIKDQRVSAVTLTGSTEAGRKVASIAGAYLKKTVLELGGSDPYIILEDADLDLSVEKCTIGRLLNAGQSCIAAKRFIVLEKVYEEFCQKLVESFKKQVTRPLVSEIACHNIDIEVQKAIKDGAKLLVGGTKDGLLYEPTILSNITTDMQIAQIELFGPVALVFKVSDEAEAIKVANNTEFGLGAAIFSQNLDKAEKLAQEIEAGSVFINDYVKSNQALPFGGIKNSGHGRELGIYGIREFINIKTIVVE